MSDAEAGFFVLLRADLVRHREVLRGRPGPALALQLLPSLFSPRFAPVFLSRLAHALHRAGLTPLAQLAALFNFVVFGIEITPRCRIGPGLLLPHTHGTVIGASRIGSNATIFQGVTLGATTLDAGYNIRMRPDVGNHVTIGAGAKILGGIYLGDRCRIGANAVVLASVPEDATAVGVPARVIGRKTAAT